MFFVSTPIFLSLFHSTLCRDHLAYARNLPSYSSRPSPTPEPLHSKSHETSPLVSILKCLSLYDICTSPNPVSKRELPIYFPTGAGCIISKDLFLPWINKKPIVPLNAIFTEPYRAMNDRLERQSPQPTLTPSEWKGNSVTSRKADDSARDVQNSIIILEFLYLDLPNTMMGMKK